MSKQVVWRGRSWGIVVEQVMLPDGSTIERGMVEHPGSVVIVPLLGDEVVLIRQFRPNLNQTILELPAGTKDPNETPLQCAQRELREETGYRAENFVDLGTFWPAPGVSNEAMTIFLATDLTHDPLPMDVDEQIENAPMLLAEAIEQAQSGAFQDMKTAYGLLHASNFLKS